MLKTLTNKWLITQNFFRHVKNDWRFSRKKWKLIQTSWLLRNLVITPRPFTIRHKREQREE